MITEKGPVSSLLHKIIVDPSTTKLLTTIFSIILIVVTVERTRKEWHAVALLAIYGLSLAYSAVSLVVVIFKKEDEIGESSCMKKIFRGRKVYWHEIQACASFTLAVTHLSAITLQFAGEINRPEAHMIFSLLNIFLFTMEFCFALKIGKTFALEENTKLAHTCFELFLGIFSCFPTFFNLIRKALFIASTILIAKSSFILSFMNVYLFHCMAIAIIASFLLFISQLCNKCKKRNSSNCGRKWQTYLMLIITAHAFLAVLTMSFITGYNKTEETEITYPTHVNHVHDNARYRNNNNTTNEHAHHDVPVPTITTTSSKWQWLTPPTIPRYRWSSRMYHAPTVVPIPYILFCIAFVLSFLDLYSRAIRSQSIPNNNNHNDDIIIPNDNDITTPLQIHDGKKIEDFVVAAPHLFTDPQKQQFSL